MYSSSALSTESAEFPRSSSLLLWQSPRVLHFYAPFHKRPESLLAQAIFGWGESGDLSERRQNELFG